MTAVGLLDWLIVAAAAAAAAAAVAVNGAVPEEHHACEQRARLDWRADIFDWDWSEVLLAVSEQQGEAH